MTAFELTRYRIDPTQVKELIRLWPIAVETIRARCPGLVEAVLVQLGDATFMDVWRWESHVAALAAAATAPSIPEAAAMFALIVEPPAMEHGALIHWA